MSSPLRVLTLSVLLLALAFPGVGTAAAEPAGSEVYVVIGLDERVDVTIDGETVETGVAPKTVLGPYHLGAGEHTVEFEGDGWGAAGTLTGDEASQDVVVHRPADPQGDPVVTVFANDLTPVAADESRLTIAHVAVVPPADVRVSGEVLFANIANGEFVSDVVPADTYSVDVVPTGGDEPLLGPLDLTLEPGALNRVFAFGRPQGGTMDAIVQVLPLPGAPSGADAGLPAVGDGSGEQKPFVTYLGVGLVILGAAVFVIGSGPRGRHVR